MKLAMAADWLGATPDLRCLACRRSPAQPDLLLKENRLASTAFCSTHLAPRRSIRTALPGDLRRARGGC